MSSKRKNIVESLSVNKKTKQEEMEIENKTQFIYEWLRIYNNTVGNYSERLKAFEELLPIYNKVWGDENKFSVDIERMIGVCHFELKNYVKAKEFFEELLPRYKKALGNENNLSIVIERMIGVCHFELKNNVKAKEIFEELLPRYKKAWGDENKFSVNIEIKIYVCEREIDKIINKKKYTKLYEKALENKNITLTQELLYKVDIECPICMDKRCNYITKCKHTMCYECKKQIKGSCPCCREVNWRI